MVETYPPKADITGFLGAGSDPSWSNRLIWGDNMLAMESLLEEFAGKVDLVYIDPPFATGSKFKLHVPIGSTGSTVKRVAYTDTWESEGAYLSMLASRFQVIRDLLKETGTLYVHLDWRMAAYVRVLLDEIFGRESYLWEIVWSYGSVSGGRVSQNRPVRCHDTILAYTKVPGKHKYNIEYLPYPKDYLARWFKYVDEHGKRYKRRSRKDSDGNTYWDRQYIGDKRGVPISTVWTDIQQVYANPSAYQVGVQSEVTRYDTQKPEKLLDRLIRISSDPGDLVADFFCGSGTTLAAAEKSGRRWIGCDVGRWAIHTTRKRLLGIQGRKPFEILSLDQHERRCWQANLPQQDAGVAVVHAYGGVPISIPGEEDHGIYGEKGSTLLYVADLPLGADDLVRVVSTCRKLGRPELHVLGWTWKSGIRDCADWLANQAGVRVRLLQVPREITSDRAPSALEFHEVPKVEVDIEVQGRTVVVHLVGFHRHADMLPEDIRAVAKGWHDFVDFWAVDWDWDGTAISCSWASYRTNASRDLDLRTPRYTYPKPGTYKIAVQVVDVLGRATTLTRSVTVDT